MIKRSVVLLITVVCSLMLVACGAEKDSKEERQLPHREPISESDLQHPQVQQK